MTDSGSWPAPDALVLAHALEKLRMREGLTLERLVAARNGVAAPLLALAAVRRYSQLHELEVASATREVVEQCVRDGLEGTQQIVADAILGLGVLRAEHLRKGLDGKVLDKLYSHSLGHRRTALLEHWARLHSTVGDPKIDVPSDRALRGTVEGQVLGELARQLIRRDVYSMGARHAVPPTPQDAASNGAATMPRRRVVVLGGAVMDVIFRTKVLPQVETSTEAHGFDLSPGGKGLTQAIAAARLGLEVALVAAIADDPFGWQILQYLRDEGVDTSLVKIVPGVQTPFTGIIEFELGNSIAVNWRNEMELRLDARDVENVRQRIVSCDAVMVTFELPRETVQRVLAVAHDSPDGRRPMVIVTPGQPYPDAGISGDALAQIDFMVAHAWELGRYGPPGQRTLDVDAAARRLLGHGVQNLCVPIGGGCTIYSALLETFTVPTFPSIYKESSAARDAFCAALTAKLLDADGEFSEDVALWATAAMAAATTDYLKPNSMPTRQRVEHLLRMARFTVAPRGAPVESRVDVSDATLGVPRPLQ